jgi:hypothetical protein
VCEVDPLDEVDDEGVIWGREDAAGVHCGDQPAKRPLMLVLMDDESSLLGDVVRIPVAAALVKKGAS